MSEMRPKCFVSAVAALENPSVKAVRAELWLLSDKNSPRSIVIVVPDDTVQGEVEAIAQRFLPYLEMELGEVVCVGHAWRSLQGSLDPNDWAVLDQKGQDDG